MKSLIEINFNDYEGIMFRGLEGLVKVRKSQRSAPFATIRLTSDKRVALEPVAQVSIDDGIGGRRPGQTFAAKEGVIFAIPSFELEGDKVHFQKKRKSFIEIEIDQADRLVNCWVGKIMDKKGRWDMKLLDGRKLIGSAKVNVLKQANVSTNGKQGVALKSEVHTASGHKRAIKMHVGDTIAIDVDLNVLSTADSLKISMQRTRS